MHFFIISVRWWWLDAVVCSKCWRRYSQTTTSDPVPLLHPHVRWLSLRRTMQKHGLRAPSHRAATSGPKNIRHVATWSFFLHHGHCGTRPPSSFFVGFSLWSSPEWQTLPPCRAAPDPKFLLLFSASWPKRLRNFLDTGDTISASSLNHGSLPFYVNLSTSFADLVSKGYGGDFTIFSGVANKLLSAVCSIYHCANLQISTGSTWPEGAFTSNRPALTPSNNASSSDRAASCGSTQRSLNFPHILFTTHLGREQNALFYRLLQLSIKIMQEMRWALTAIAGSLCHIGLELAHEHLVHVWTGPQLWADPLLTRIWRHYSSEMHCYRP